MSYSYGTSGIVKGQVTAIADHLTDIEQIFEYEDAGGGIGQVSSITENRPNSESYSTTYAYNAYGDRETASYGTNTGTVTWKYQNYVAVGDPASPSRVFQTLTKMNGTSPTTEEFHYAYMNSGALKQAAFAQTPNGTDYSVPAGHRARAYYTYDPAGRVTELNHWWDNWNTSTSSYDTPIAVLANSCDYELSTGTSNLNRGLKTTSVFYEQSSSNVNAFSAVRTELYGYDTTRDYLTTASYDGGTTTTTWSYDAAGNRNDATVVDNLNRATTIGGVSRTYDILGNTLTKGSTSMTWDVLNRMTGLGSYSYSYRADGIRTKKAVGQTWTSYRYDGQMPIEEYNDGPGQPRSFLQTIRYGLGARGIDYIERITNASVVTKGYPVYDAHGNNVATLQKSGTSYTLGDQRSYDAWGGVRTGSTTGEPNARYCANLGHLADDESGFIYMRARYYEPGTGRFVNLDLSHEGKNRYIYGFNNPIIAVDKSGHSIWGTYENVMTVLALIYFLSIVFESSDMLDVENAYGYFTGWANYSFLTDTLGLPDWVADLETVFEFAKDIGEMMLKGLAIGAAGGNPGIAIVAGSIAACKGPLGKVSMIELAYGLRLQWYVDHVDN